MPKSRPILIIFSILAGLGVITASSGLGDLIGAKLALVLILLREAAQVGMNFYVQGQVVPTQDVAAYDAGDERGVIAGPAAAVTNGAPVSVVETTPAVAVPPPPVPGQGGYANLLLVVGVAVCLVVLIVAVASVLG